MKTLLDSSSIRLKIHLTELMIVLLLGLLSPILTISLSFNRDSGWFCTPQSNDVVFYGVMLPQILMFLIGLVLLFLSLWILRRVSLAIIEMHNIVCKIAEMEYLFRLVANVISVGADNNQVVIRVTDI